ncbi:ABC1 family-domain-containing protein [Zopfochytrium polystomum]|nr:ABC1 family-domain-containing protein [Zopfochytrium polystomum]
MGESKDPDEYLQLKSKIHQRSANTLLAAFTHNGGIYIKLGQHIAALQYLLPVEYTKTMQVLQDRCPPTPLPEVEKLILDETGSKLSDLFSNFEETPIGVASLAQVHRAVLQPTASSPQPMAVAVKVQHPPLRARSKLDIALCSFLVGWAKRIFPDFEFAWLAEELRFSLPRELDFVQEADNARKVAGNFRGDPVIRIPEVHWASHRLLIMEFVEGKRVDDVEFMNMHGIDVRLVSNAMSTCFNKMIFVDGFVHCDPHPGNVFVRPRPKPSGWWSYFFPQKYNFDLVLLDHGLYRHLTPKLQYDYARLWDSLIRFNEAEIEDACYTIFTHQRGRGQAINGVDHHRLFASMITGRPWAVLSLGADSRSSISAMATTRTSLETTEVQQNLSQTRFLIAISDILAKLPREVLLLLKTNDLLRSVDESLGVAPTGDAAGDAGAVRASMRRVAVLGAYCAGVIRDRKVREMSQGLHGGIEPVWLRRGYWDANGRYWDAQLRLMALSVWIWTQELWERFYGPIEPSEDVKAAAAVMRLLES